MNERIKSLANQLQSELISVRRHLHQHPELSFQEYKTADFIAEKLSALNIPFQKDVAGTGIVAIIKGKNPYIKCIALRADMDALPITEKNETTYKSTNEGVMHACGHDVHATCLLGAAMILSQIKDSLEGTVKLIFQPGEEKAPGGASLMINAGVLENPKPNAIIGLHVFPELPVGYFGFKKGKYMASADEIFITINGKGGHAALPQNCIDPIAIAATLICSLQQIVSRKSHPLTPTVLTFGKICGGTATNIIPDKVEIWGTLRTFDEVWRQQAIALIKDITNNIVQANGATADINIPEGYPYLLNDELLTEKVIVQAQKFAGNDFISDLQMRMTAEDFSFYTQKIPGCFFRLGTNTNNQLYTTPVHNAHFDIDEAALSYGAGMMAWLAYAL